MRDARLPVLIAVLICMSMVAIEATIVTTAMPQLVGELGDFELYSWVFTAYLLGQTTTTMMFGKLADIYGRKPVLFVGLAIFAFSSLLAGYASDMSTLSIIRGFQGLGAGAIHPVAMTVVGDLYRGPERGRVQGYFLGIWVLSSLLGPPLGSLVTACLSWKWIFWLNLPLCCAAAIILGAFLKESPRESGVRRFDWLGSVLLIVTTAAFVALLIASGRSGNETLATTSILFLASLAILLWQQGRENHGVLSLSLWKRLPICVANGTTLFSNMATAALSAYLPLYLQVVMSESPGLAGLTLTAMLFAWQVAAMAASRLFHRLGFRLLFVAGGLILPVGALLLLFLGSRSAVALPLSASVLMGFGMGLINMTSLLMVHEILPWEDRASATAVNLFARNFGSAIGASGFGLILNTLLGKQVLQDLSTHTALSPNTSSGFPAAGFETAAYWGFSAVVAISLATLVMCLFAPGVKR